MGCSSEKHQDEEASKQASKKTHVQEAGQVGRQEGSFLGERKGARSGTRLELCHAHKCRDSSSHPPLLSGSHSHSHSYSHSYSLTPHLHAFCFPSRSSLVWQLAFCLPSPPTAFLSPASLTLGSTPAAHRAPSLGVRRSPGECMQRSWPALVFRIPLGGLAEFVVVMWFWRSVRWCVFFFGELILVMLGWGV